MKPNKKKPRIRNRPRNKANRQIVLESQSNGQPTMGGVDEEVNNEKAIKDDNNTSDSEDDMPDLEDEADTNSSKLFYVPEEDEAIKTIQRFMRDKVLKQQQMRTERDTPVKSATPAQTYKVVEQTTSVQILNTDTLTFEAEEHKSVKPLAHTQTIEADTVAKAGKSEQTFVMDALISAVDTSAKPVVPPKVEQSDTAVKPLATSQMIEAESAAKPVTSVQTLEADACDKALTSAQAVEADKAAKRSTPKHSAESRKDAKTNASLNQKSANTKGKPMDNNPDQNAFIQNIQKKMEAMMANGKFELNINSKKESEWKLDSVQSGHYTIFN